jgi:NADPH-dependent 7-cyano-7-deazaguanine reductase QueF
MEFRKDLEESVNIVQDMVINLMDPSEFRITNRFTYIFGFSAEVTPEGLQELTEIDEVVSIEKDL